MAVVAIRILEGLERGRVFASLTTPISIGREEENDIQLNDDRVSRFHAKLQDDSSRVILTDLDSTNGTRVNGHPVNLRVIRVGDVLSIGRCLLQIQAIRTSTLGETYLEGSFGDGQTSQNQELGRGTDAGEEVDFLAAVPSSGDTAAPLFPQGAPEPPDHLKPLQRAQLSDLLAHIHERLTLVLQAAHEHVDDDGDRSAICPWSGWGELVNLGGDLAQYLRVLSDPEE